MKAIVQDSYGSADVLEFRNIEEPAVGDGTCSSACSRPAAARTCGT